MVAGPHWLSLTQTVISLPSPSAPDSITTVKSVLSRLGFYERKRWLIRSSTSHPDLTNPANLGLKLIERAEWMVVFSVYMGMNVCWSWSLLLSELVSL